MAGGKPVFPEAVSYLFDYFRELCWTRRPGYSGPLSLEYREIEAWCRLNRRVLEPWELRMLLAMDVAYIRTLQKRAEEKEAADAAEISPFPGETLSKRPMSPELFDALFANDNKKGVA